MAILLVLAGGVSNFLDRIFWGGVVDFISLPFFPWKFNLADVGITVGVVVLLYGCVSKNLKFKIRNAKLQCKIQNCKRKKDNF